MEPTVRHCETAGCGGCAGTRACMGPGEHDVTFFSSGEKRAATLTLPRDATRPAAAILVHDFGGHRNAPVGFARLAGSLAEGGIASLRFDLQGCGESGPVGVVCPTGPWAEDVLAAASFAESLECLDPCRLAVIGLGVGAGVAVEAAAMDERIRSVVAFFPVVDGRAWLRGLWETMLGDGAWEGFLGAVEEDRRDRAATGDSRIVPIEDIIPGDRANGPDSDPHLTSHAYLSSADSLLRFRPVRVARCIAPRPVCVVTGPSGGDQAGVLHGALGEPRELHTADVGRCGFGESTADGPVRALVAEWLRGVLR